MDAQEKIQDDLDLAVVLHNQLLFFKKYSSTLLLSIVMGFTLGLLFYFITPKQYASSLLLHSMTFTNTEQIRIIENWDDLIKGKEYAQLAHIFSAPVDEVKKINHLEAAEIQKLYIPNNPNGFAVEASVSDNQVLDSLQYWIIRGLEHEDYIHAKMAIKKANLQTLIATVQEQIRELDSTKSSIDKRISGSGTGAQSFLFDISNINSQVISLNEKLLGYKEELKFAAPAQVLHPFEKFDQPENPKLLKYVFLGTLAGFVIGYFISVVRSLRTKMKRFA